MAITSHESANYIRVNFDGDGNTGTAAWAGGRGAMIAQYVAGTGTITLQYTLDGGTTYTAVGSDTTLTGSGGGVFNLPATTIRINAASTASTPNINAVVGSVVN